MRKGNVNIPYRINTREPIANIVTVDDVIEAFHYYTKFGENLSRNFWVIFF